MPSVECSNSTVRFCIVTIPSGWISLQKELLSVEMQSLPTGY